MMFPEFKHDLPYDRKDLWMPNEMYIMWGMDPSCGAGPYPDDPENTKRDLIPLGGANPTLNIEDIKKLTEMGINTYGWSRAAIVKITNQVANGETPTKPIASEKWQRAKAKIKENKEFDGTVETATAIMEG